MAAPDKWQWRFDPALGYYVRDAYQLLTSQDSVTLGAAEDLLWHRQVPLKVSIFAWRLLRDRLPTKTNLVSHGILPPDLHFCASGCGGIETAQHLFLSCGVFGSLWPLVRFWIGFSAVDTYDLSDQFSPVHFFSWWSPCSAVLFAACMARLCLGDLERKKSPGLQQFGEHCAPAPGQSQGFLLPLAADDRRYFSY